MYFAFHADTVLADLQRARWHWLARTTKLPDSLYRLAWSPNGRYLVGVAMGEFYRYSHLALFTAPPSKPRILVRVRHPDREVIRDFGWYPDSRRVWYATGELYSDADKWRWYKVALSSPKPVRIRPKEQRLIQTGWDFLPCVYRYSIGNLALGRYAYTADRALRIQYDWLHLPDDIVRPLLERRNQPAQPLQLPAWLIRGTVHITDVSLDKRHLLVCTDEAYYVVVLDTNRWTEALAYSAAPELFGEGVPRADFAQSARLLR